ncbi:hypothetical protein HG1285_12567, partial [Hydrogenivirga sp. 128-5-R1-1]
MDKLQDIFIALIYIVNNPQILKDIEEYQINIHKNVSENVEAQKGLACEKGCAYCCYGWQVKLTLAELFLF